MAVYSRPSEQTIRVGSAAVGTVFDTCSRLISGSSGRNTNSERCWGHGEAPVEPGHKLIEHRLCLPKGSCAGQPQFGDQPVLKCARRSLNASFGLGRLGKDHLDPQLVHGPTELGRC